MIPQWQQDIINSQIRKYIYKIEWLTPSEEVIDEVTVDVISGSANFDGTKNNQRGVNLTLKNLDKQYIPKPNSKLWINNKFRLQVGYEYGSGETLMFNQGVYCLGNPSVLSNPTNKEVVIQGLDKWTLLDGTLGGKLKNKLIIPIGTRIDLAMKMIIDSVVGEKKYILDHTSVVTPYTIEAEAGKTIAEVIIELGNIISFESFYDNEGFFRFRKFLEPEDYEQTASVWNYTTNGLYLQSSRELLWTDVRNSILVVGDTLPNGITISATAQDTSNSDMSVGVIGEKFELVENQYLQTNQQAQELANWELKKRIMLAETVKTDIIPNFSHKVNDIISVLDENNGCLGNYIIQNISYNFSYDTIMNMTLWKIRNWR